MDALKQSSIAFRNLLKYEYEIVAGSKKTLLEMKLFFAKEHFMHLIGLHKLTDLQIQRHRKDHMYEMVLEGKLTYDYIKKSVFFPDIEERIILFPVLETALDSNELMIKYKQGIAGGTIISAAYIIVYHYENTTLHYFVDEDGNTGRYYGKSFFGRKDDKFLKNQQTFKILKKVKCNVVSGEKLLLKERVIKKVV